MNNSTARSYLAVKSLLAFLLALLLTACVTEITGGLPPPASGERQARAQLDLARGYLAQGDYARVRIPLFKALEIQPKLVEGHVLLAVLLNAEQEYELAEARYKIALKFDANNALALNNYGTFLYARGRFTDAVVPLARLVKNTNYPGRSQAFENLGLAHLYAGDETAAEAAFVRSLQLNTQQPRAAMELAELAYARGDYPTAQARLSEYTDIAKPGAKSFCLALKIAIANGVEDDILRYTLALKNLFPEQAEQCQVKR